ncbi:MAG TPA: hypothetical protein DDZ68_06455 [Parvularcula sp.]|nr:hypothetical protein [Parvularcula sp.]
MPQLPSSEWALIAGAMFVAGWMLGRRSTAPRDDRGAERRALDRQRAEADLASLPADTQQ